MSTAAPAEAPSTPDRPRAHSSVPRGRWLMAFISVVGLGAIAAGAVYFSKQTALDDGTKLTHTIARSDLTVTVTEQGTVESSNNTEIKCKVRGWNVVNEIVEGGTEVKEGDVLVRLDTKRIEDAISTQTTTTHSSRATLEESKASVARAELAIPAYVEGEYRTQLQQLEQGLEIAQTNLETAQKMLDHCERLFKRGYVSELEVEGNKYTVQQAELDLKVQKTQIDVLNKYTKQMRLERLNGNLKATKSKLEADRAGLEMDEGRLALAEKELGYCVITAPRDGMVIHPSSAAWKNAPEVAEGANVRKDQVLLLMPDLAQMQVKVGIHESIVDRVKPGQTAKITLPEKIITGKVSSVASVTRPAGWWTGNVVKYDTMVELPSEEGLKPGMSAEVEVIIKEYKDVLTIPVAAVVETEEGDFCWVKTAEGTKRRALKLGDTDDSFIIVDDGLAEGDVVMLNPLAEVDEAQSAVRLPVDVRRPSKDDSTESERESEPTANAEAKDVD